MPTIFGWSPGLRALAGSAVLPCGCLSGTYTTWGGRSVVILDARGVRCRDERHEADVVLGRE